MFASSFGDHYDDYDSRDDSYDDDSYHGDSHHDDNDDCLEKHCTCDDDDECCGELI